MLYTRYFHKKTNTIFSALTGLFISTSLYASHFYNISDCGEILSGIKVNTTHKLNIATNPTQETLIHPRVAITAVHGGIRTSIVTDEPIKFGDQEYRIIRKYEPADAIVGGKDFCLLFLDRNVEGAECRPLAMLGQGADARDFYVHTLSHNKKIQISGNAREDNTEGVLTYGQPYCRIDRDGWPSLSVSIPLVNPDDKDLSVPIGGDSGSSCFVSTQDGSLALAGIMSSIGDDGRNASYINIGKHKNQIEQMIQEVLGGTINLATVSNDQWDLNPACLNDTKAGILPRRLIL